MKSSCFQPHSSRNPPPHKPYRQFTPNQRPRPIFQSPQPCHRHFPPPPTPAARYNFTIQLSSTSTARRSDLQSLIPGIHPSPDDSLVPNSDSAPARLFYKEWAHTLKAVTYLWRTRLEGTHFFSPKLISRVLLPSDEDEVKQNLQALFCDHVGGLLEGDMVKKWQGRIEEKSNEIAAVSDKLKGRNSCLTFNELHEKKKGLLAERELLNGRLKEFKSSMNCLLGHLKGITVKLEVENDGSEGSFSLFDLDKECDWEKIHHLIIRECRRLEDGLPIYAFRQDILKEILEEQVLVLIGETGSGKSTQLVQFLADSGITGNGSIVCAQPRKIAAITLADRVREESNGCYKDRFVSCHPAFSSDQQFDAKVIFMTDHCLLQHYMNNRNLSGISCIIIDEAHERSLNTDLLLALVKDLLEERDDIRLIIMSATADAQQLADYFFKCKISRVLGRNFPVDIRYVPYGSEGTSVPSAVASYVADVVRMAAEVHRKEKEGTILAFLTSQMEVEWACDNFKASSALALPLHGKLSFEDQFRIFQNYPGKRKVIFATNVAETSLTIPGVKYVIDSGMVKESKFEPANGMNVLRVCRTSQSSAKQRAGRAGRTEPGICYRLYEERDFELMTPNQEPEIRRVHLGVAVLRILALGIKNVQDFDFVDAPSSRAIDMAIRNLLQLGAITRKNGVFELTEVGRYLVKLGIEPRLGKMIMGCSDHHLGKEGLVLAAVMANASSIFCRVGSNDDKLKADCLKVQFCHRNGDLFTLLSVYKEWEALPQDRKSSWCWQNSINAKSMWRCQDTVKELELCLQKELNVIIPSYWKWNPHKSTEHDKSLQKIILSSLAENTAMYSGCDQLGYEVALTGQYVRLHPSCSLQVFGQKPSWVVFGELLAIANQYLVCVTAFDVEYLFTLDPPPLFDVSGIESRKLQVHALSGFGRTLLKKFCGKANRNLHSLVSHIRSVCMDERIGVDINFDQNDVMLFCPSKDMEKVRDLVNDVLERERKWLRNECLEKCLYRGTGASVPIALFGAGAEIKHFEHEKRCLTVDISHSNVNDIDDKELLMFLEKYTSGSVCAFHRYYNTQESDDKERWGKVTFSTPDAASKATELNNVEFAGSLLKVVPSRVNLGSDHKFSFAGVKAKVYWPRRPSKGFGIVKCNLVDVGFLLDDFSNLEIRDKAVRCEAGRKSADCVVVNGIDKELSEIEVLDALRAATKRRILDFFLPRGDAVEDQPCGRCEEALLKEIAPFMPRRNLHTPSCRVQVFPPEPKDLFVKAFITFDGRFHLEAAQALEQLDGKVLPGCHPWQKIKCQQLFHSSLSCPESIYAVIKKQLLFVVRSFNRMNGVECYIEETDNRTYRVKISANATKRVAELRRPLEELVHGTTISHPSLTPTVLQHLFCKDGINLMKSIGVETRTYVLFDRHSLRIRIFGSPSDSAEAEKRLVQSLLFHHGSKQLEVRLRGRDLPPDLMKQVVKKLGPDLCGLKERIPGANFTLSTRYQTIYIHGDKELKRRVEGIVHEIAQTSCGLNDSSEPSNLEISCPICLCEVDEGYQLESCSHLFCQSCLVEQFESAIKNLDSFPVCCAKENCGAPILLSDLKSLLPIEKLEELFRASLGAFVASSGGMYRFCPSPDCPSVYCVPADTGTPGDPFVCGACYAETCTRCHLEYHPYISCERYREFKEDPDLSLKDWCKGKDHVKTCPVCGYTIEKVDGCNHLKCNCGKHICWDCLDYFNSGEECYDHLRSVHGAII